MGSESVRDTASSPVEDLNEFVTEHLRRARTKARNNKVIHEALWGTNLFYSREIALMDTPLVQRLRGIHQTGLGYLTFPTAVHSRFDHSLGTLTQCGRFAEAVRQKQSTRDRVTDADIEHIRLAALLHDIGHCLFSHTSEQVYAFLPHIKVQRTEGGAYEGCAPHEILTCNLIETDAFREFFEQVSDNRGDIELPAVKSYIAGKAPPESRYKGDFLNGPFDADKIDYLFRDGHFSGIPIKIDLDRLRYSTDIGAVDARGQVWQRLVADYSGATSLEQIIFHKIQLFPTLYHHHKVRAADCMLKGILEHIRQQSDGGIRSGRRLHARFDSILDFLWTSEADLFAAACTAEPDSPLHGLIHDLQYRRLLKRVLVLSKDTVDDHGGMAELYELRHPYNEQAQSRLRDIASKICKEAAGRGLQCALPQVWFDLPDEPSVGKDMAYVMFPGGRVRPLNSEVFPIMRWIELHGLYMWRGHVYAPDGMEQELAPVAKCVLESEFDLKILDQAFTACHVRPPS